MNLGAAGGQTSDQEKEEVCSFRADGKELVIDLRLFSDPEVVLSGRCSREGELANLGVCLLSDRWLMGNLSGSLVSFRGGSKLQ